MRLRHHLHPLTRLAALAALALTPACARDEPTPAPTPQDTLPPQEPSSPTPTTALATPEALAEVRPKLRPDNDLSWGRKHTSIPGHYGAWLLARDQKPVLLLTVDDLLLHPERHAWLRARTVEIAPGLPADISTGNWIHALVADRYEVSLLTQGAHLGDHALLLEWFDKLNLKPLLPETPRP
jgi:hypothetical protein